MTGGGSKGLGATENATSRFDVTCEEHQTVFLQLSSFVPQAAGFQRVPVRIKDLKKRSGPTLRTGGVLGRATENATSRFNVIWSTPSSASSTQHMNDTYNHIQSDPLLLQHRNHSRISPPPPRIARRPLPRFTPSQSADCRSACDSPAAW